MSRAIYSSDSHMSLLAIPLATVILMGLHLRAMYEMVRPA